MLDVHVGVLGAGFGLYGYVPACSALGMRVHTLERYREVLLVRPELAGYVSTIQFHDSEQDLHTEMDLLVCARDPASQMRLLAALRDSPQRLLLEKPLAPSINDHNAALAQLVEGKSDFAVGYIFPYTFWYDNTVTALRGESRSALQINWIMPPPSLGWKATSGRGGGIADFYAIHFVPMFMELNLGADDLIYREEAHCLEIQSVCGSRRQLRIIIRTDGDYMFRVAQIDAKGHEEVIFASSTPFGSRSFPGCEDPRVPCLIRYLQDAWGVRQLVPQRSIELEIRALEHRRAAVATGVPPKM